MLTTLKFAQSIRCQRGARLEVRLAKEIFLMSDVTSNEFVAGNG